MARSGGFTTSLTPFGSGTFGNLAQYDIGDSIKDLANYQAEVAWGNGQLSDADYLDNLRKQIADATPGTQAALSAQNKYDDVFYRINRQVAEQAGLDALIAFDQQTLATMNPSNLRYRDVQDSLNSELARRRSRDYGIVVDAYNAGQASTEELLAYVSSMLGAITPDAPDYDQWAGVVTDLEERLVGEKDTQVYQDYQDRKIAPADFIAYVQGRRDGFASDSPKWDDWNQRLLDAQKNVHDTAHSDRDAEVFRQYNDGKISDKTYLRYLSQRVDDMAPDDPARPEWVSKLAQGTFSLAEDLLTYEVNKGTKPVSALRDFYKDYATTLNRGSAEWRRIDEKVRSLSGTIARSGGGGGTVKPTPTPVVKDKVIVKDLDTFLMSITPDPTASPAARAIAVDALKANDESLRNAIGRYKYWVYYDPTKPGQTTAARDPITGELVKDAKGKQQYVLGSGYLPVSDRAAGQIDEVKANYSADLAVIALKNGDQKNYWRLVTQSLGESDSATVHYGQGAVKDLTKQLDALDKGIEYATSVGDAASVLNGLTIKGRLITGAIESGLLTEARENILRGQLEAIGSNPLFPSGEDRNGDGVAEVQTGGWVDMANSPRDANGLFIPGRLAIDPTVHFILDRTENGKPAPNWVTELGEGYAPGVWVTAHQTVTTNKGARTYQGEVKIGDAPVDQAVILRTASGEKRLTLPMKNVQYISYVDGDGKQVTGYSLDGREWLMTDGLQIPVLEIGGAGFTLAEDTSGGWTLYDPDNNMVGSFDPNTMAAPDFGNGLWLDAVNARGDLTNLRWYAQDTYLAPRTDPDAPRVSVGGGAGFTLQPIEFDGSLTLISKELRVDRAWSARLYGQADLVARQRSDAASAARYAGLATVDPKYRAEKALADRWTGLANYIAYKSDTRSELNAGVRGVPQPLPVNQLAAAARLRAAGSSIPPLIDTRSELNAILRKPPAALPPATIPSLAPRPRLYEPAVSAPPALITKSPFVNSFLALAPKSAPPPVPKPPALRPRVL